MLRPSAVVELVWQDETDSTAATMLSVPSSLTVTEIDAAATALASILASLTGAVLVKQRIKYVSAREPLAPASGSTSILRTGAFFFGTADGNPIATIFVRAIKDDVIVSTGPEAGVSIDLTNSDVITFVNAVIDNNITNVFADDVTDVIDAYLQSRV